jgi:hypothetical protein
LIVPEDDSLQASVAPALQSALDQNGHDTTPVVGPLHQLAVEVSEQVVVADFNDAKPTWQFDEAHVEVEFGKVYTATVSEESPFVLSGHIVEPPHEQMPVIALWDTLPVEPVQPYHQSV